MNSKKEINTLKNMIKFLVYSSKSEDDKNTPIQCLHNYFSSMLEIITKIESN